MADQQVQHTSRSWKTPVIVIGVGLLGLVLIVVIFESMGVSALSRAVKEARALGGPLTLKELEESRPGYTAEKNGANVILAIQPKLDAMKKAVDQLKGPAADDLPIFGPKPDPVRGERWTPAQLVRAQEFLAAMQSELTAIDTLKDYPGGCFPVQMAANPSLTDRPHLPTVRFATKLKGLQTLDRAMRGDASHLVDDVAVMLRAAQLVEDEPSLVSTLVAVSLRAYAADTLERACAVVELDAGQLEQFQAMFSGYDPYPHLQWAVRSERAVFIGGADYYRSTDNVVGLRALFSLDEARGITCLNRILAQPDAPGILAEYQVVEQELAVNSRTMILTVLFPHYGRALDLHLRGAAELRAAELAMAVERYRLATGAWPQRLDVLMPDYIKSVPEDPFAPGQPLRMSIKGDRLTVYSLDMDRDDDGGVDWDAKTESGDTGFVLLAPSARPASRADAE